MRHIESLIGIGATLALLATTAPAQQTIKGRVFTDKTHGYKLALPSEWSPRPIHMDATRLIGWFHSHKRYRGDPEKGDTEKWKPSLLCVVRLDKPAEGKAVLDYPARLKRQLKAGTYKATHVKIQHHGIELTQWDVEIAGASVDRERLRAWVLPREDHDLAVEFWIRSDHFAAKESAFMRTLQSVDLFAPVPLPNPNPILSRQFELRPWLAKSVLDRHSERAALGMAYEKRVESKLPVGWTVHRSKHILIVSHCDPKTTKRVHKWIDLFYEWLDDHFASLSDEYPIRTVIRLCANATEYHSYRASGGWRVDYNFADREVVMCDDRGNFNMKDVLWAVFRRYMLDNAPEVYFNMPTWLNQGMRGLISRSNVRHGKLVFPADAGEIGVYDDLRRSNQQARKVLELMNDATFGYIKDKVKMDIARRLQARVLLRFFDGPGRKCKAVRKDFLLRYFQGIRGLARDLDFADPKVMVWDSEESIRTRLEKQSGDGEKVHVPSFKSRWEAYSNLVRERRAEFTEQLHARVCAWSRSEWSQVDRAYAHFCRSKSR